MTALGLHQLVPASLLAGRWIIVLACYLDDSGKGGGRITTLAGYAATEDQWNAFEAEVEAWFTEFGVNTLHTMDLHRSDNEFKDAKVWTVLRKQAFVARLCQTLSHHVPLAVSFSVVNAAHKKNKPKDSAKGRAGSPYGYCFHMIVNWLLEDLRVARVANTEGIAMFLEAGHENNPETEWMFNELRRKYSELKDVLRSISFVQKEHSRAIQMADLLAFYSRRYADIVEKTPKAERPSVQASDIERVVFDALPFRNYIATAFSDQAPPTLFLRDFKPDRS